MKIAGVVFGILLLIIAVHVIGSKKQKSVTENIEGLKNEFMKYGKTVREVLSHRGEVEDWKLDSNIGFILLNKQESKGLASFTAQERYIYSIEGMVREVNNGGFNQFFFNSSGDLSYDIVPALEAIGSIKAKEIAQQALKIFGKPSSLDREQRIKHLEKITKNFESDPWNECDDAFYSLSEPLETMMLEYIDKNISDFDS